MLKKHIILVIALTISLISVGISQYKDSRFPTAITSKNSNTSMESMKIFEASVSFPYPNWFTHGFVGDIYKKQNGASFIFEEIPLEQTFDNWKELYAVYGLNSKSDKINLEKFIIYSIIPFQNVCGKNIKLAAVNKNSATPTYLLFCGKKSKSKYGEVAILKFFKVKNTYIKVYQEWNITPFEVSNLGSNSSHWIDKIDINKKSFNNAYNKIYNKASAIEAVNIKK